MTVMVRNTKRGLSVFADPQNDINLVWEGAGDPSGGDVRAVPDSLLENVNFINAINLGTFAIEEDDAAAWEKIRLQAATVTAKRDVQRAESLAAIDRTANRTIAVADIDEQGNVTRKPVDGDDLIEIPLD